jgi:eukaryotic-like serine/threonine-protein kinase
VLALLAVGSAAFRLNPAITAAPRQAQDASVEIPTPPTRAPLHIALSPDGSSVAVVVTSGKGLALWVSPLDPLNAEVIPESQSDRVGDTGFPFWSPDGSTIAFFNSGKLKKVSRFGGPSEILCDAAAGEGGSWSPNGVIVFAPDGSGPLFRISGSGGAPTPVTTLDESRREVAHRHPWFLPDGIHFLYLAVSSKPGNSGIWVGSIDSPDRTFLLRTDFKAAYAPPGDLLYMQRTTLMARHFDPQSLTFTGDAFPVAEHVGVNSRNSAAGFTTSSAGTLAFRPTESRITVLTNWDAPSGSQQQ